MEHAVNAPGESILIIGPSWVGDMVMAQTLFRCLQEEFPSCRIDVMAPVWALPLVARMDEVTNGLELPFNHGEFKWWQRRKLGKSLRENAYTRAIVLPNSFKSALIPFYANIPVRTGWLGEKRWPLLTDVRKLDKQEYPLMVQRFAALAYTPGRSLTADLPRPRLSTDEAVVQSTLSDLGLQLERPVLAICPGAEYGPSKQWPAEYFATVCNEKLAAGWQVWVFGSANDSNTAAVITGAVDPTLAEQMHDLTGRTSLAQAIDLLSLSSVVITNDSGLMHIAAALERPIVALYGSTTSDFTPPLTERVKLLATDIECRPCFERECPLGHLRCLTEIRPEQAVEAIEILVAANK